MPNELHKRLQSIIASIGFNDGANKGFWRVQPRQKTGEDAGQWIEMGADLRMFYKDQRGKAASVPGRAVGSTGTPDGVRVLVQGEEQNGVPDGIYAADTANVRVSKAILPEEVLEKQGIQNVPQLSKEQEDLLPTLDSLERADITDDDIRLINEGAESKEGKEHAEYRKSVEAEEKKKKAPKTPVDRNTPVTMRFSEPKRPEGVSKDARYVPPFQPFGGTRIPGYWIEPSGAMMFVRDDEQDMFTMPKIPLAEIFADVAYNGDTDVKVDDLLENLKKQKSSAGKEPQGDIKPTLPISLDKGDVIREDDGSESTIIGLKFDNSLGGRSFIRVQSADGTIKEIDIDTSVPVNVVKGKKGKPVKPAKPAAKPTAPATPAAKPATPVAKPSAKPAAPTPSTKPAPVTKPANTIAPPPPPNFPPSNRIDNGAEFGMPQLKTKAYLAARKMDVTPLLDADGVPQYYTDQDGKLKPAYDPASMMQVLAEVYPDSRFTADGLNLILTRMKDKDGKMFELRASNAGQKAISYSMRWTDPNTGEFEELVHYDTRESITSLFRADNGPDGLMDKILGRGKFATLTNGPRWKVGPDATFRQRAQWFVQKQKMMPVEKMVSKMANGRSVTLHKDDKNFGRIKDREILSTWEAIEKLFDKGLTDETRDEIYLRMESIFGSVPSTDVAHQQAMTQLRADYDRLFKSRGNKDVDKLVTALITNASMHAKGKGFTKQKDAAYRAIPYASADRHTPLKEDMVVGYENNVGQLSVVKVVERLDNVTVNSKDGLSVYNYKDFVRVIDGEGVFHVLSSKELKILKDQNTPLTKRYRDLRNDALTRRRIEQGLIQDPATVKKTSPMPGAEEVLSKPEIELEKTILVDNLIPGDDLFDENGELIGEIIAVEPTQDNEGNNGFAFLVLDADGEEVAVFYPQGTEIEPKKE